MTNQSESIAKKELPVEQCEELIIVLKTRFEDNMHRHADIKWEDVQVKLDANTEKLWSLNEMERTGGEPDVIGFNNETDTFTFCDCSAETPSGRRSICYDPESLESRKKNKPAHSAVGMATEMGVELLDEVQYRELQQLENFDKKTSTWIKTPSDIRKLGGGLFCDFRFGTIFVYHNGVESYYAGRGFRGLLNV
ncbi:DUF4256 domain-containing protein [Sporosarcina sp. BI001-red]|uniref:DUF4256 domain-containing protein n=1 Tax=Sporosarcina sp. BI001-red TaxID=2282866 RepID=UPI000E260DC9|nr:DUF4256 domain-containing protein [Sporosarcina sp. BI001-red]REB05155.1 DUF4256 domain-containing protein [Sporosarcina sp. BI001-red]